MTLLKPKCYTHPTPRSAQKDLNPEPARALSTAERNDALRRALVRKTFGSSAPVRGEVFIDSARPIGATERQRILELVLEHGTHRGDTFEDAEHTRAVLNGCEFVLAGGSLCVKVSR